MQVRVREVVRAAEHVADLVVDRRPRDRERRPGEVGAVERVRTAAEVLGALDRRGHTLGDRADPLLGDERGDRVGARRVERLDAVRHRVDRAGPRDERGQRDGQLGVVDDDLGEHRPVVAGLLARRRGHPPHRRHLRAGVGRRHRDDREAGAEGDDLRGPGRGTAADAEQGVGARLRGHRAGALGDLVGDVRADLVEDPDDPVAEDRGELLGERALLHGRDEQEAVDVEPVDLGGELLARGPGGEDDAPGQRVVGERADAHDPTLERWLFAVRTRVRIG